MSVDSKIDKIESARNTIRSKMVAAGQASSSDKLADLADNLTFEKYYSTDDSTESTLANDDYVPFYDTSATAKKKSTWNNIKSKLKTYFDTLYPSKTTFPDPTSGDSGKFLRGDSTWQEISAGGGHTIEDPEGTALTQRDTLQFGGDLEVSDDDENEKTVVAPHELTAAELTEIMSTLPGQPTQGITIDLRGDEQVVGKVIESDGTEKTLYQKIITGTFPTVTTEGTEAINEVALNISNIDTVYAVDGIAYITPWSVTVGLNNAWGSISNGFIPLARFQILSNTTLQIITNRAALSGQAVYVTLQYTKTTS